MTSLTAIPALSRPIGFWAWGDSRVGRHAVFAGLIVTALLVRHAMLGNPLAGFDEQFYLMVGDRMWQGAWPYVDIWDRKPLGLFVIYAAIRALGGDGVWQSHVVASLFAGGTAVVIAHMVMRGSRDARTLFAGYASGALYLLFLNVFGGGVGQAPVFYNLFVAGAAACVRTIIDDPLAPTAFRRAAAAMALCGLALTVKTTAIVESLLFGLVPLLMWWQARVAPVRIAGRAIAMMTLGAAPFVACALPYIVMGRFDAFWFANAQSAMLRPRTFSTFDRFHLIRTIVLLSPLIAMALLGGRERRSSDSMARRLFLIGWVAAAILAALSVGIYFEHYAMNVLTPLCVCGGAYFRSPIGRVAFVAAALAPLHVAFVSLPAVARSHDVSWPALRDAITPRVQRECMLVYHGPPIFYHASHACTVTSHPFPSHFWAENETNALGVDQNRELTRAIARRPAVIVTDLMRDTRGRSPRANAIMRAALARSYVRRRIVDTYIFDRPDPIIVWQRRDLPDHRKL